MYQVAQVVGPVVVPAEKAAARRPPGAGKTREAVYGAERRMPARAL